MSNISGTIKAKASLALPESPEIFNVSIPLANTEVEQALGSNIQGFTVRCRGEAEMKLAFTTGESGTKFITIPKGCSFSESDINFSGSVFLQTNKPGQTVEVLAWS